MARSKRSSEEVVIEALRRDLANIAEVDSMSLAPKYGVHPSEIYRALCALGYRRGTPDEWPLMRKDLHVS